MVSPEIVNALKQLFGENNVKPEWDVAKNSSDALTRNLYCPRVDIAVGPFNIDRNIELNNHLISEAYEDHLNLIEAIKARSDIQYRALEANQNPRCFIAIEIEHRTSRKHRLGSMVNASAMGKVGIIAATSPDVFDSITKIRRYLEFLEAVGKSRYNPRNVMIVLAEDLLTVLEQM
jgi:hypothetical protein